MLSKWDTALLYLKFFSSQPSSDAGSEVGWGLNTSEWTQQGKRGEYPAPLFQAFLLSIKN